jgi:hypothetical protein
VHEGRQLVASVEKLLQEARLLDLSSTEGRFRLGEIAEALRRELPAAADLHDGLAIDLEVDRDTITQVWFVASAFPPPARRPHLPWASYVLLRVHPARHELVDRAAREGWDQDRLERELSAWFAAHHHPGRSSRDSSAGHPGVVVLVLVATRPEPSANLGEAIGAGEVGRWLPAL